MSAVSSFTAIAPNGEDRRVGAPAAKERRVEQTEREAALQALHDRHAPELWRFALRLTHDAQAAEDVVQEALLRAWRDPALTTRGEAQARAWLFTVVRHLVVDRWRSAASRHEVAVRDFLEPSEGDRSGEVLDHWLIAEALSCLSRDHRRVIASAYYEGRSVAEIAAELRIPEGTVKSRLHYGLRSLRLVLQEKGVTRP
jgi:RNA polymerase sigma-70 factor (ECF subfamily)